MQIIVNDLISQIDTPDFIHNAQALSGLSSLIRLFRYTPSVYKLTLLVRNSGVALSFVVSSICSFISRPYDRRYQSEYDVQVAALLLVLVDAGKDIAFFVSMNVTELDNFFWARAIANNYLLKESIND